MQGGKFEHIAYSEIDIYCAVPCHVRSCRVRNGIYGNSSCVQLRCVPEWCVVVCCDSPVGVPLHHAVCIEEGHRDSSVLNRIVAISLPDSNPHLRTVVLGEGGVLSPLLVPHSKEGGQVDE